MSAHCLAVDAIYVCTLPTAHPGPHQAWTGSHTIAHQRPHPEETHG
jgi:hypothetical protein